MPRFSRFIQRPTKSKAALWLALCIVGGLFLTGCGGGGGDKPTPDLIPNTSPDPTKTPAPDPSGESVATLTADQLADKESECAGKVVTVTGMAVFISTKPDGSGVVQLQHSGGRKTVRVTFPLANWTRDKIRPGEQVGVKGMVATASGGQFVDVTASELVQQQSTTATPTASTPLTAAALAKEFRKHGGKVVTVDGVVESAVETSRGVNVVLTTSQGFPRVRLTFPTGKWTGDKPAAGDSVSAKGTVSKAVTATTFVDMSDCELVKHTPAPLDEGIPVTAVDVTAEFEKDAKAAEARYKDKLLRVTGEVLRASDAGGSAGAVVFLKGAKPTDKKKDSLQVSAVFTGDAKADALKLKAGDTVTFTGKVLRFKVEIANNDWTLQLVQPKLVK